MPLLDSIDKSNGHRDVDINKDEGTTTHGEDDDDEDDDEEDDSGNEDDEDFLSEDLNLPDTEDDGLETDSAPDYPVIMDDSDEDRIFKRQLSYPPIPMYHPPRTERQQGGKFNPRDKIGVLTPMEEVTEPPSSAATSIDGDRRSRSRNRRATSRNKIIEANQNRLSPPANFFPKQPSPSSSEQKSILKSKENLQEGLARHVTFEGAKSISSVQSKSPPRRIISPAESVASYTSEYSSMADSGRLAHNLRLDAAKNEIQDSTIVEEAEETADCGTDNLSEEERGNNNLATNKENGQVPNTRHQHSPTSTKKPANGKPVKQNSVDLDLISDMEQGEKVIHWQMENARSEKGNGENPAPTLDSEFPSIVNGIIAELHNLDELIGSSTFGGVMEVTLKFSIKLINFLLYLLNMQNPQYATPALSIVHRRKVYEYKRFIGFCLHAIDLPGSSS